MNGPQVFDVCIVNLVPRTEAKLWVSEINILNFGDVFMIIENGELVMSVWYQVHNLMLCYLRLEICVIINSNGHQIVLHYLIEVHRTIDVYQGNHRMPKWDHSHKMSLGGQLLTFQALGLIQMESIRVVVCQKEVFRDVVDLVGIDFLLLN